jgi:hypothetical protein
VIALLCRKRSTGSLDATPELHRHRPRLQPVLFEEAPRAALATDAQDGFDCARMVIERYLAARDDVTLPDSAIAEPLVVEAFEGSRADSRSTRAQAFRPNVSPMRPRQCSCATSLRPKLSALDRCEERSRAARGSPSLPGQDATGLL